MRGRWQRAGGVAGRLAAVALAVAVLTGAAPAAPDDEFVGHPVPDAVVESLEPGGSVAQNVALDTGVAGRPVSYGTPILLVRLSFQRFTDDASAQGGKLRVSEVSDPVNAAEAYLWLVPVLAGGKPAGSAMVHEDGGLSSITAVGDGTDPLAAAVVALPTVDYLVATQVAGTWAIRPDGRALPVDDAGRKLLAARFDRPAVVGLSADEFRTVLHEGAVAADAAPPGRPARPLVERVLGVAMACVGVATLGLMLPRRRAAGHGTMRA